MKSREEINQEKQEEIIKEQRREAQKKVVKRIVKIFLFLFVFVFLVCFYITKIGTVHFIVQEETLSFENLPESFDGLKVIQFSDLHYEDQNLLKKVVAAINQRHPDLLLFTGDLVSDDLTTEDRSVLVEELKKLDAPLGKYAVLGEEDQEEAKSILVDCGFSILADNYELIYRNGLDPILLIGLDTSKEPINYSQAFQYYSIDGHDENIFSILMLHKPDYIDEALTNHSVNFALAGHSHLGQVRLPLFPPFVKKDHAEKYIGPYYEINNTKFYVSSGIGTSDYPYRFMARPSINFFRLTKKT